MTTHLEDSRKEGAQAVPLPRVPPLTSIYFYLTEGCNLSCRHCWVAPKWQQKPGQYGALEYDLFVDIVRQAKKLGLVSVKLTGGEPLLHPEAARLLQFLREENLAYSIETNGVLCTPELAQEIAAGQCSAISVSLDGATASTHEWMRRVPGCFEAALEGVRTLVKAGVRPQIIMAVTHHNKEEAEDTVELAKKLGASSVKFCIVTPVSRGRVLAEEGQVLNSVELIKLAMWLEGPFREKVAFPVLTNLPCAFRPLGNVLRSPSRSCSVRNIIGVLWDGRYALCGIGVSVPELVFGDARENPLQDVWSTSPMLHEVRGGLPDRLTGICQDCVLKYLCLGCCIAHNYYFNGTLWSSYPICQVAYENGCFPEHRIRPGAQLSGTQSSPTVTRL